MFSSRSRSRRFPTLRRLLALLVLAMGLMLVPSSSWAGPDWCPEYPAPVPAHPGAGTSAIDGSSHATGATLFEGSDEAERLTTEELGTYGQFQHRGMDWHTVVSADCFDGNRFDFWDALYSPLWRFSLEMNQLSTATYMAVTSNSILDTFEDLIVDVTEQFRDTLWRPLIPSLVIIGAVTLAWYAFVKRQATLTAQGAVWMIFSTAIGMYMLFAPATVIGFANTVTTWGAGMVNQGVANLQVDGMTERCPADGEPPQQADWETEGEFSARQNGQMMWEGLSCRPWLAGLLGGSDEANQISQDHGMDLLQASTITMGEYNADDYDYNTLMEQKQGEYETIARDIAGADDGQSLGDINPEEASETWAIFSGNDGAHRASIAAGALMGSLTGALLILIGSVALLGFQFAFVILLLLAPVFFLIGIHPGVGRGIFWKWFSVTGSMLVKQIVTMLLIGLLVLVLSLIMANTESLTMQSILILGLIVGLFLIWKPLWSAFSSLSRGTDQQVTSDSGTPGLAKKALGKAVKVGAAVATGGSTIAAATGLPYGGKARAAGKAARGTGRKASADPQGGGVSKKQMDGRWGGTMDAERATDGDNGGMRMRRGGAVGAVRDVAGARPTHREWRQNNPALSGFEAHRWAGMTGKEKRAAVSEARQNPEGYVKKLQAERENWRNSHARKKTDSPPPLTPHQNQRRQRIQRIHRAKADRWTRRKR